MEKSGKLPVVILIGAGSKLPSLIKAAQSPNSKFQIKLVVSHKSDSWGVTYANSRKIPAVYFKLPDYRNRLSLSKDKARESYMKHLGWFISQKEYAPKLLVFAGWDLIMDASFFNFFKSKIGDGYCAINLHPALLPQPPEKNKIVLPDKTLSPVIKGEQQEVLETVLTAKVSYFGPTVHFMSPKNFDSGKVVKRQPIKVGKSKTPEDLRKKLMPIEDKLLVQSINIIAKNYEI